MGPRTLAVFDLDGTLTRRDTLLPFLRRVSGRRRTALALLAAAPLLMRSRAGGPGAEKASHGSKQAVIGRLLAGRELVALTAEALAFAGEVVAGGLRPDALPRIDEHRRSGDELVMVTASPELYAAPIGALLGFDVVLGTRLEVTAEGRLTGRISGLNCRGTEKVARLAAWSGPGPHVIHAYGDSSGDRDLLAGADTAVNVGRRRSG
ncbi:MAG: HAD-IB family hydrolase [Acidimicrobiales bacterium]